MFAEIKKIIQYNDEANSLVDLLNKINKQSQILDVGCGYGRNIRLLKSVGFQYIDGIELNQQIIESNKQEGICCYTPEEFKNIYSDKLFDLIIMSHIVEHFDYRVLKEFIEHYLNYLNPNGYLLISTPLFHAAFYNDFDHIKPYYPIGLNMVFGKHPSQVQLQSNHVLQLINIAFYKDQWRLQYNKCFYVNGANRFPIYINRLLKLFYAVTKGLIGKKVGWIGLYQYLGHRVT